MTPAVMLDTIHGTADHRPATLRQAAHMADLAWPTRRAVVDGSALRDLYWAAADGWPDLPESVRDAVARLAHLDGAP